MAINLIVDKDGFFTGSYHRMFDPKNLELSYESANLILEDVDSAFEEMIEHQNKILARRQRTKHQNWKPHKVADERILAPSDATFAEACEDYIRRSPSQYSCRALERGASSSFRCEYALSEVSDSTQHESSEAFSILTFSSTKEVASSTHQLASFVVSQSRVFTNDYMSQSTRSRNAYRPPFRTSSILSSRNSPMVLSTSLPDAQKACPQLLNNIGVTSRGQSPKRLSTRNNRPIASVLNPSRSQLATSMSSSRPKSLIEPFPVLTIKTLEHP